MDKYPIQFSCSEEINRPAVDICTAVADVTRWREFQVYAFLPGIASAEFELRTDDLVGSLVRVQNKDSFSRLEETVVWQPGEEVVIKLYGFTPPCGIWRRI